MNCQITRQGFGACPKIVASDGSGLRPPANDQNQGLQQHAENGCTGQLLPFVCCYQAGRIPADWEQPSEVFRLVQAGGQLLTYQVTYHTLGTSLHHCLQVAVRHVSKAEAECNCPTQFLQPSTTTRQHWQAVPGRARGLRRDRCSTSPRSQGTYLSTSRVQGNPKARLQ